MSPALNCTACGRRAMVPKDDNEVEAVFVRLTDGETTHCEMTCCYCGESRQAWNVDANLISDSSMDAPVVREAFAAEKERERVKAARLKEGRW